MHKDVDQEWTNKKIAVVGLGVTNLALIQFLKRKGARLTGHDQKTAGELGERYSQLQGLGVDLILGPHYLQGLQAYDAVFLSPGVPKHLPQLQGIRPQSEMGLVFRYSRAPIFAITGSSGKTTVTALVREMLTQAGLRPYVGGNIGRPLITQIEELASGDIVVLELSSFQLENLGKSPRGALVTNISENHLDMHGTMANYIDAKRDIYRWQKDGDFAIFNYDDAQTRQMAWEAPGRTYFFSLQDRVKRGAYRLGDALFYEDEGGRVPLGSSLDLALLGEHNVANFLAAAIMSHLIGASWDAIRQTGQDFPGVRHRLEFIAEIKGVRYYNDSIATTPQRTMAALHSFAAPLILIAGGSDKMLSFSKLAEAIHTNVKKLILLGATAAQIRKEVLALGDFPVVMVDSLDAAVSLAAREALPGEVVLLSPACASFDLYADFAARGSHFQTLVEKLLK